MEPQHLAPDDAMVFHFSQRSCAPALVSGESEVGLTISWRDAPSLESHELELNTSFGELLAQDAALLRKGAAIYKYAEVLEAHGKSPCNPAWSAALSPGKRRRVWQRRPTCRTGTWRRSGR